MVRRFGPRLAIVAALSLALVSPRRGSSADVTKIAKILADSDDYRLRVGAALSLGNSGDKKALPYLEEALSDPHPSVRQAAAAALAKLGDASAIASLEARAAKEANAPTKSALEKAIAELKSGGGSSSASAGTASTTATFAGGSPDWTSTKYVVELRKVTNQTAVRGAALAAVLDQSARTKIGSIAGVFVLPSGTTATGLMATAKQKGLPVLGLDAGLVALDEATLAGDLKVQAKVSFAISKSQTVKASVEGNASSIGSTAAQKNPASLAKLQDMAVEGAVTAVMAKLPSALKAAAASP